MQYIFKATETFWRNFYALTPEQKELVRSAWRIFKTNPFDVRLGAHSIRRLSAVSGKTIYSVVIDKDLRSLFYIQNNIVFTFDIGSHKVYR